jgi:hypothetical protein
MLIVAAVLLAFADSAQSPPPPSPPPSSYSATPAVTVVPFRTEAAPRVDPVFGDVASFRAAIDRFLALQGEMDQVRDEFSSAVHATLAALAAGSTSGSGWAAGWVPTASAGADARQCPMAAALPYARALASGGHYLLLGQQLQASYRELRRGDDLGDTLGLTPDYRLKVKKARELHQHLLTDYREMRVAFYDQLGAEMRHAGCKLTAKGLPPAGTSASDSNPSDVNPSDANPSNPVAWELAEDPVSDAPTPDGLADGNSPPARAVAARATTTRDHLTASTAEPPASGIAPAIWIELDNSLCNEPTRLSIDGQPVGDIGPRNQTSVRSRSGPHEVCALPTSDHRTCGDPGTIRKAYLHEGWRLTIHCAH